MGVHHRDYMRPGFGGGSQSGSPRSWSVVTWLIVINVGLFVVARLFPPDVFFTREANGVLLPKGGLSWEQLSEWKIWTPFTYMFLHGSVWHLAANMFVLFFAGRNVLEMLGTRHFLAVYFGGGLMGAGLQMSLGWVLAGNSYLIGASGGVVATLIALAVLIPNQKVYLLLFFVIPIRMKMKTVAWVIVGADLAMLFVEVFRLADFGIGNLAHLGGALFGWLYVKRGLSGARRQTQSADQAYRWLQKFGVSDVVDADMAESEGNKKSWFKSSKKQSYISADVDEILEKISAQGMQSLTDEERRVLEKSSEKLARMTNRVDRD